MHTLQKRRLLPRLHKQMIPLMPHKPIHHILFALGPTPTTPRQHMTRRAIHRQRKQIRGLAEIRNKAAVQDEINEHEEVHDEDQEEDGHPGAGGGGFDAPGGVLLGAEGSVEELGFVSWPGVVLGLMLGEVEEVGKRETHVVGGYEWGILHTCRVQGNRVSSCLL
jgi:hypothetical protein